MAHSEATSLSTSAGPARTSLAATEAAPELQPAPTAALVRAPQDASQHEHDTGPLLAVLAHELRTPLTPVALRLQMLRAGATPSQLESIDVIDRNIARLAMALDQILEVARNGHEAVAMDVQACDVALVIRNAARDLEPVAIASRVRLEVDAPHRMPVAGDAERLEQVVANLVRNAIQFSRPAGRVRVTGRCVGGAVTVRVSDNGIGIDPARAAGLFQPFFRGSDDPRRGGVGLGLYWSRAIVEHHGGSIRLESAGVGQGTVVEVRLPQRVRLPEPAP